MRVGIFGGTFNPPHIGHVVGVGEARSQLDLDKVLVVPVGIAPHKEIELDAGAEARYELCRRMAHGEDGVEVSRIEIERAGPSFTVDTLRELRARSPGDELHLILGADEATALGEWHDPTAVLELARLAVAEREGIGREQVLGAIAKVGSPDRVEFFSMPRIDVSSTLVRERVASFRPFRHLVPRAVADYIEEAGLYAGVASGEREAAQ